MMKKLIVLSLLIFASCKPEVNVKVAETEISCGQCQFGLKGEDGCSLAVKVLDQAYFVEGFKIDDFGDAHDEKIGFCNVIRKGSIEGKIENGRFIASSIKLVE